MPCHCTTPCSSPPESESTEGIHTKMHAHTGTETRAHVQRHFYLVCEIKVLKKWGRMRVDTTWKTVTMAHSRESKFFLSGTVSPASVFRLNLQPKMCIPRILQHKKGFLQSFSHTCCYRLSTYCIYVVRVYIEKVRICSICSHREELRVRVRYVYSKSKYITEFVLNLRHNIHTHLN